jgi:hypothetical protein
MPPEAWSAVTLLIPPADPNPTTQSRAIKRAFDAGIRYGGSSGLFNSARIAQPRPRIES